jgi:cell division protein FtsA
VYAEIEKGHSRYQFTLQDQQACIAKCREEIKGLVLHAIPLEFKLNGHNVLNPLGAFGQKLSVCTHLIYGKEDPLFSMVSAIQKSGFYLAGLICPSFASAQIYATNEELQSGIILVEMGTHVTSISIFQYGVLQRFITIPIGGARFTDDLAYCLKLSKFEAEELKCKEGSLLSSPDPLIKDILEARFNEWISFVQKTIQGLAMSVVIYGSPTQLPGFIDLFSSHIWQPVRSDVLPMFKSKLPYDGMNIALGALLYALKLGTLSYLPEKSIKKQIKDWISHLF